MNCKTRYLNLLKQVLLGLNRIDRPVYKPYNWGWENKGEADSEVTALSNKVAQHGLLLCSKSFENPEYRYQGGDWPIVAETMIGMKRLENIEYCFNQIIENEIPGDLIEAGVWRGGATIFMKALLTANAITNRKLWVADSFEGLPKPNEKYIEDKFDQHYQYDELSVSLEEVKHNFEKYNLLDEQVIFLKGWFADTLPIAPIEKLALLRVDGDMYGSTIEVLENLYPKLSVGGFVIIDDWGAVPACKKAVMDFRSQYNITEEIQPIDWCGVYWKKQ
ncbi:MAG: macrocin O-methyltransferase [Bacteroidales bacterium]|nr:macrocin O-methyltransferase [Bacteroidales bacterium]